MCRTCDHIRKKIRLDRFTDDQVLDSLAALFGSKELSSLGEQLPTSPHTLLVTNVIRVAQLGTSSAQIT